MTTPLIDAPHTWVTRGGYSIVAGPILRPMNCFQYVVLNDDGHWAQLHVCKCFSDGRISKRGESQYDLIPPGGEDEKT